MIVLLSRNLKRLKLTSGVKGGISGLQNQYPFVTIIRRNLSTNDEKTDDNTGLFNKLFGIESNTAQRETKRWKYILPAFATHMCIGAPWAWSLMADSISREYGFVAPAATDWTLLEATFPMSIVFLMMGVSASVLGEWQMRVGPRKSLLAASACFGGGMIIGAAGIHHHSLPLLYAGYGFLGGLGVGLAYTPPVQTLMQWFPDKKGIASGMTIAGFGSGALFFTPVVQSIMKYFARLPEYVGPAEQFHQHFIDGKLFVDLNGSLTEVVQAGTAELAKLSYPLEQGLYVVGSGSTGASEALAIMGVGYSMTLLAASLAIRRPPSDYIPPNNYLSATSTSSTDTSTSLVVPADVSVGDAMKSPQFHLIGFSFFCLVTGGMGMFSVAKPMMSEVFSAALPAVVTSAFASKFLLMLSAGNLGGRLGWAAVSDMIGRKNTVTMFCLSSIPLYLSMPTLVDSVVTTGSPVPMYAFCTSCVVAVSMMGGIFAITPAYEADIFGTKQLGAIHGRMLLYVSGAALSGPALLLTLRDRAEHTAVFDFLPHITAERFAAAFGDATLDQAEQLLASKTLTIGKVMALMPPGTLDPTPHLYDTTMYSMSCLMALALVSNQLVNMQYNVGSDAGSVTSSAVVVNLDTIREQQIRHSIYF